MIKSKIGKPAVLEQLAEECCELAQISLKRARILRGENPTPKTITETDANFLEEIADVLNCISVIADELDMNEVRNVQKKKLNRWKKRIMEVEK